MELMRSEARSNIWPPLFSGIALLFLLGFGAYRLSGQSLPQGCLAKPTSRNLVVDKANLLEPKEEQRLNQALVDYMDSTSNVMYVVTHPDFCGMEPSMFATAVGHEFGVGRADKDNGVVIAIKPRNGSEDGRVFIAVGYGLEGAIPDVVAQRVVDRMLPDFADGDWMGGLWGGTEDLRKLASGEFTEANYMPGGRRINWAHFLTEDVVRVLFVLFVFSLFFFSAVFDYRKRNNTGFFLSMVMIMGEILRSEPGTYRDFSGGSGWGSGSGRRGGGGFGGFGGGGFGGGGAGGRF